MILASKEFTGLCEQVAVRHDTIERPIVPAWGNEHIAHVAAVLRWNESPPLVRLDDINGVNWTLLDRYAESAQAIQCCREMVREVTEVSLRSALESTCACDMRGKKAMRVGAGASGTAPR